MPDAEIPDLRKSLGTGDYPEETSQISFKTEVNGALYCYAYYNEYSRYSRCMLWAGIYYGAVRNFGWSAFKKAQDENCYCKCPDAVQPKPLPPRKLKHFQDLAAER